MLNGCVEYLNSKDRSAQTSAHTYMGLSIHKKKEDGSLTEKLRGKVFTKSGFQTENEIKEPNHYSKCFEGKQVKQTNTIGKLHNLMRKII